MSKRHLLPGAALLAILILFLALWTSAPAGAATSAPVQVEVDTTIDSNEAAYQVCSPADNDCSLRGAISKANADTDHPYIISLPPNTYTLTLGRLNVWTDLAIRSTVQGQKAVIDGNGLDRVLHITPAPTVALTDLTITNGRVSDGDNGSGAGGILNTEAKLIINHCAIVGNRCGDATSNEGEGGLGGGIFNNRGALTITHSTISHNQAGDGYGDGLVVSGGYGGGIFSQGGTVSIADSTLSHNSAGRGGNGMQGSGGWGGGIWASQTTLTIDHSTLSDNHAGPGGTGEACSGGDGGGIFANDSTITIRHSIIRDNSAGDAGDCSGFGCDAGGGGSGGGILATQSTLTIEDSTVSGNKSGNGGNCNGDSCRAGSGGRAGGINNVSAAGSFTLEDSTISGNNSGSPGTCTGTGCLGGDDSDGGGLVVTSSPTFTNTTFSGNYATGSGGGIYLFPGKFLTLIHCTLTGNVADEDNNGGGDGGGLYANNSTVTLKNSLVAGNEDRSGPAATGDCAHFFGTISSLGYNVVGEGTGCPSDGTGDQTTTDARLGPLAGNGGPPLGAPSAPEPTLTHALLPGSPALNAVGSGQNGCGTAPAADQRDVARPQGGSCDSGAFELGYALDLDKAADQAAPLPGQIVTFTLILTNTGLDVTGGLISDTLPVDVNYVGPIALDAPGAGTAGSGPPVLAQGLALNYGEKLTIAFPVTVDLGLAAALTMTNRAWATSSQVPTPTWATATLTVGQAAGLLLVPDRSGQASPGSVVTYSHTLTNSGNGPDTFDLSAASSQGWVVVPGAAVSLESGQSAPLVLSITVPAGVIPGAVDSTNLTITSRTDPSVLATVTDTTIVTVPMGAGRRVYLPLIVKED